MTPITISATFSSFEAALAASRSIPDPSLDATAGRLAAALDNSLFGRLDEAWELIESALTKGFRHGRERAQGAMETAIKEVDDILQAAGIRAKDLQELILLRLREYLKRFVEGAMSGISTQVLVGGKASHLRKVSCTQKIVITGTLKSNLLEAFALTCEGEIEIVSEYEIV